MSMPSTVSDVYALIGDLVTHHPETGSAVTAPAIFEQPGELVLGADVQAVNLGMRFPTENFPDIKRNDQVEFPVASGTLYVVRTDPKPVNAVGDEKHVALARPRVP
jgi:hypothetical protein